MSRRPGYVIGGTNTRIYCSFSLGVIKLFVFAFLFQQKMARGVRNSTDHYCLFDQARFVPVCFVMM
jgi:hypothetical protein